MIARVLDEALVVTAGEVDVDTGGGDGGPVRRGIGSGIGSHTMSCIGESSWRLPLGEQRPVVKLIKVGDFHQ